MQKFEIKCFLGEKNCLWKYFWILHRENYFSIIFIVCNFYHWKEFFKNALSLQKHSAFINKFGKLLDKNFKWYN